MKNPTLQQLINQKIREKGLTRHQLVSTLGYTNISKGCRRLDHYLASLHPPSEEFLVNLLSILEINFLEFNKAVLFTHTQAQNNVKERFVPYLKLLIDFDIRPLIARQEFFKKYRNPLLPVHIQKHIQALPFNEEIKLVIATYQEQYKLYLSKLNQHFADRCVGSGFRYYRHYDNYLEFNADAVLVSIVAVEHVSDTEQPIDNRVINMLTGGM